MEDKPKRLSGVEFLVLKLLTTNGAQMFGLELVQKSGGRLKRGTVYVTLGRMEEKGYVTSRKEARRAGARGLPRRQYQVTALGARSVDYWDITGVESPGARA